MRRQSDLRLVHPEGTSRPPAIVFLEWLAGSAVAFTAFCLAYYFAFEKMRPAVLVLFR